MKNNSLNQLLSNRNLSKLARRITEAGYPINRITLYYWAQGKANPRPERLELAERTVRPTDPEMADLIHEIYSSISR